MLNDAPLIIVSFNRAIPPSFDDKSYLLLFSQTGKMTLTMIFYVEKRKREKKNLRCLDADSNGLRGPSES